MKRITVIPAYNRDYKSIEKVTAGLQSDKDFKIADVSSPYNDKYVNLSQLKEAGFEEVRVRFAKLTKVVILKVVDL